MSTHALYSLPKRHQLASVFVWILSGFNSILALSDKSRSELVLSGVPEAKIKPYTYWVDQSRFKPGRSDLLRQELGWKDIPTFLFVGRLIGIKGIKIFLGIVEIMTSENIQFVIIGSGPEEPAVEAAANRLSNLIFIRNIPNNLISKYYCASDILMVPSIYAEGMARVVMEGISSGLYVISSNFGSLPEMIRSVNVGILVAPNFNSFHNAIDDVLDSFPKIVEKKNFRKEYAKKFFSNTNAQIIIEAYK